MRIYLETIRGKLYLTATRDGRQRKRKLLGPDNSEVRKRGEALVAEARAQVASDEALGSDGRAPRLADMAGRYLREDVARLARTTRDDRPLYLSPEGPLLRRLGSRRMDQISPAMLRSWWGEEVDAVVSRVLRGERVTARRRSDQTGRHYLNVLQAVYRYAMELGLVTASPVPAFREVLRRHAKTKGGRAAKDRSKHVRPFSAEEIPRLVAAAAEEGAVDHVIVLLGLDAGLRLGEILGLAWGHVVPGADDRDLERHLFIADDANRPRGGALDTPKSGRVRRVELSRRLRSALLALRAGRMNPAPTKLVATMDPVVKAFRTRPRRLGDARKAVVPGAAVDPGNWRRREWRRICERAGVGMRAIKDLRDTYASHLVSAGFPLAYVSEQLGHGDMKTTAEHYARWIRSGRYVPPPVLEEGEVPADVLARLTPAGTPISLQLTDDG